MQYPGVVLSAGFLAVLFIQTKYQEPEPCNKTLGPVAPLSGLRTIVNPDGSTSTGIVDSIRAGFFDVSRVMLIDPADGRKVSAVKKYGDWVFEGHPLLDKIAVYPSWRSGAIGGHNVDVPLRFWTKMRGVTIRSAKLQTCPPLYLAAPSLEPFGNSRAQDLYPDAEALRLLFNAQPLPTDFSFVLLLDLQIQDQNVSLKIEAATTPPDVVG